MRQRLFSEAFGTFVIVFAPVALGSAAKAAGVSASLLLAALASGLPVLAMISALGGISGAHFNPAVTMAFAATKKFPASKVGPYILAQLAGAALAGAAAAVLFGAGGGVHIPAAGGELVRNLGTEIVITFILMFVIAGVATDKRTPGSVPPLAIGMTVVFCILVAGPITGGSMNPARSFGPALFGGPEALGWLWLYATGPVVGALLGAFAYELCRREPDFAQAVPSDLS